MQTIDVTPNTDDPTAVADGPLQGFVQILDDTDQGWLQNSGLSSVRISLGDPTTEGATDHVLGKGESIDTSMFGADVWAKPFPTARLSFTAYSEA